MAATVRALAAAACAVAVRSQFTKLTDSYLNVADVADGFGPEDKAANCNGDFVFLDLDSSQGVLFKYTTASQAWSNTTLTPPVCSGGGSSLWPRDQGYVLASTNNGFTGNKDRLVALGGSPSDTNVFYSDDCGMTWTCVSTPQPWVPRHYSAMVNAKGALPGDPLVMAGGISTGVTLAQFHSADGGLTWARPACTSASPCQQDCQNSGSVECTLPEPDPIGSCSTDPGFELCYLLPDLPLYPGGLVADWSSLYYWLEPDEDGMVWSLNTGNIATGWTRTSYNWGGFGRKVFLKGATQPNGCWFSTDFSAEDLWIHDDPMAPPANSMNSFAVTSSSAPTGWRTFAGNATWPWPARGSALLSPGPARLSDNAGTAYFASGFTYVNGQPQAPVFSDAYQVDVSVCLLSTLNNLPCAGYGAADLAAVKCTCNANSNISPYCDQCNNSSMFGLPDCAQTCPAGSNGVCNNNPAGNPPSGTCDPVQGCVCATGWTNGSATNSCDQCAAGYFGPSCLPCTCNPNGNAGPTPCNGSGTRGGTGTCASCKPGLSPPNCMTPFTKLTDSFLDVADPNDGFGAEDKLVACKGNLVFLDLDNSQGVLFTYTTATSAWGKQTLVQPTCDGGASPPLWPRDAGYVVAVTKSPATSQDRMIVLGGDDNDVNVWWSDDCGVTWTCSTQAQAWVPRIYAATVDATGILPGDPLVFAGGLQLLESVAQFHSTDGGITWSRPACAAASPCQQDCLNSGNPECTLPEPDPVGSCAADPAFQLCMLLPDAPCFPGSLGVDWNSIFMWLEPEEDGMIWKLDKTNINTGWSLVPGTYGGFGRRNYIKGAYAGTGCWFSTDWSVEDLWIGDSSVQPNSMNSFATASSAAGPWLVFTGNATWPWPARASAAVTSGPGMNSVIVASGMTFVSGQPQAPVFSDVYQVDVGVCLLAPVNNQICAGAGAPDFLNVDCACTPGTNFLPYSNCGTCNTGSWNWPTCGACATGTNGVCNNNPGSPPSGSCDPVVGCKCAVGWANGGAGSCDTCAPGYFGADCLPCTCYAPGNAGPTACDGSGSGPARSGTGVCDGCNTGFTGANCDTCLPGFWGPSCLPCTAPCTSPGGTCSQGRGGDGTCQCAAGWTNAPAGCTDCAVGFYGPVCQTCLTCQAPGGLCDGSGTHSGNGACDCQPGWTNQPAGCTDCSAGYWGISCSLCTCDPNGGTCSGSGTHGGDGTCGGTCNQGYAGVNCETCAVGWWGTPCQACSQCDAVGGVCSGSGTHSGDGSCSCNAGFMGADCSMCQASNYGPNCAACAACSAIGGSCDGGGSRSGSGACVCNTGFTGSTCAACLPGYYGGSCSPCMPCDSYGGTCSGSGTNGGVSG